MTPPTPLSLQAMAGAGTVSGSDMTSEAALAKLSYVLGLPGLSLDGRKEVRRALQAGVGWGGDPARHMGLGLESGRGGAPCPLPTPRPGPACPPCLLGEPRVCLGLRPPKLLPGPAPLSSQAGLRRSCPQSRGPGDPGWEGWRGGLAWCGGLRPKAPGLGPRVLLPQLLARDLRGEMTPPAVDLLWPSLQGSKLGRGVAQLLSLSQVLSAGGPGSGSLGARPGAGTATVILVQEQEASGRGLVLGAGAGFAGMRGLVCGDRRRCVLLPPQVTPRACVSPLQSEGETGLPWGATGS